MDRCALNPRYERGLPEAFYQPWSAIRQYRRVQQPMLCADNNQHLFDYHIPVADTPDF